MADRLRAIVIAATWLPLMPIHAQTTTEEWMEVVHYDLINGTEELIRIPVIPDMPALNSAVQTLSGPFVPQGMEVTGLPPELLKGFGAYTPITAPTNYPYSTTCKLWITLSNFGLTACTGVLIGPRHIATAGGCLRDAVLGQVMAPAYAAPGYHFGSSPFGQYNFSNAWVPNEWSSTFNANHNLGFIELTAPVGLTAGYLGIGYADQNSWFHSPTPEKYNIGYPSTNDQLDPVLDHGERMYIRGGHTDYAQTGCTNCLCHNQSGYRGMGGSPLYYLQGADRYAVGVFGDGSNTHSCYNRFTTTWVNFMNGIINVSIPERNGPRYSMAPNPARDQVLIDSEAPIRTARLHDATGRLVREWRIDGRSFHLDIQGNAPGLYLLRLHAATGVSSGTLVIEP